MIRQTSRKPIRLLLVTPHATDVARVAGLLRSVARFRLQRAPTVAQALAGLRPGTGDILLCDSGMWVRRPATGPDASGPVILLTERGESGDADADGSVVDYLRRADLDADRLALSLRYAARWARLNRGLGEIRDQLNPFFRRVPCAICIFGTDGRIRFSNELFRKRLKGLPRRPPGPGTARDLPWRHFDGKRHWLVSAFEIKDRGAGLQRGLAAFDVTTRVDLEVARERQAQLLAGLLKHLPIVVGRVDRHRVTEASGDPGAAVGLAPGRLRGRSLARLHPGARQAIERALGGQPANCVVEGRTRGGFWQAEMFVFPDPNEPGTAVFFARDITGRRRLENRILGISEAEQRRLGADLHDGLGQHLTGTACLAVALRDQLTASRSAYAPQAATVATLVDAAIEMTRGLAHGLCPVQVEKRGLSAALEDLSYQVQRLKGVDCHVDLSKAPALIAYVDPETATHLYRIAQEAINNALRHADARHILVTLGSIEGRPFLAVDDDGRGFEPRRLVGDRGLGLQLMAYRAAMIGGVFRALRSRLGGARVECVLSHPLGRKRRTGPPAGGGWLRSLAPPAPGPTAPA